MIDRSEVRKHASKADCWVIIKNRVYNVTDFLEDHPGGSNIILKYAGQDATKAFEPMHSGDTLQKYLKPQFHFGPVIGATPSEIVSAKSVNMDQQSKDESQITLPRRKRMVLSSLINIRDFEIAAIQIMEPKSFAFFKAGADDEYTAQWNRSSWQAIRFRPRVLRPIENIDLSTSILGTKFSAPFFISPAGGGKLAHPTGEILMTRAAAKSDILQWVCNMAGCSQQEMADARGPAQTIYWQIYAASDLKITEGEIKQAIALGYKGFALTVDAVRAGKRERDMRMGIEEIVGQETSEEESLSSGGISAKRIPVWSKFDWVTAIRWIRSFTDLPIAIKGIQCWEDAALCMQHGVHPWLSNHGGRQLQGAPSAVETMLEIRQNCPEVFVKCEVIVDGGILRGTDIVKALALGAKSVGIGRGFLYALVFGEAGVSKAIRILQQEMETAMALLGVNSINQLNPSHVDTSGVAFASRTRPHL